MNITFGLKIHIVKTSIHIERAQRNFFGKKASFSNCNEFLKNLDIKHMKESLGKAEIMGLSDSLISPGWPKKPGC